MLRDQALEILQNNIQNLNLCRHCLAVGAVMKALAEHFGEDEKKWEIVGLMHDADYEKTKDEPQNHTVMAAEWLTKAGADDEIVQAVKSHNFAHTGENPPQDKMEWTLYCCDELTGFIVAKALVMPDKKISSVKTESVLKKMKDKSFARNVKREQILDCEKKLGISLKEFVGISLRAMQGIDRELGL